MTRIISPIQEIIAEMALGRMVILMDDEDRENEGDLVIAAEDATAESINFMARYGRGLICLAVTRERAEILSLPPMSPRNQSRMHTNFTVSIEAREGITTGISAFDRAHTIQTAIDPSKNASALVSPGHVFPLVARDGGVLVRTGHTEASVDLARLAGKKPAGVICEIMKDDGTMARLPDLIPFAQEHGLKIGTIADLVAYRRQHDLLMQRVQSFPLHTAVAGDFTAHLYLNDFDETEHLALVKGNITPHNPVLVRVHATHFFHDLLGTDPNRHGYLEKALKKIDQEGVGVCVLIRDSRSTTLRERLPSTAHSVKNAPFVLREYGIGASILADLGVRRMRLLTGSNFRTPPSLEGYGLEIIEMITL